MEGLQALSNSIFELEQKFRDPPPGYRFSAVEISASRDKENVEAFEAVVTTNARRLLLSQDDLCQWFTSPTAAASKDESTAILKLCCIRRELDVSLDISQASFAQILSSARAHPSVKYMICRDYDGFHEFKGAAGFLPTSFLGNALFALVWTFDEKTLATAAVFIDRRRRMFSNFVDILCEFSSLISTSLLIGFAGCCALIHPFDRETSGWELNTIRTVEESTGFGPHPTGYRGLEPKDLQSYDIGQLTSWLQAVNEVAGNAGNRARHTRICLSFLDRIRDEQLFIQNERVSCKPPTEWPHVAVADLDEAALVLRRHISTYIDYLMYLKDRSERLSTVLFTLLTHEDAAASIDLAAAARRDGSSMKTIAVMTMLFLPATFFAALFALPSLQWDQETVVQANFWIYWAFTLPTTALVFMAWMGITGRSWIKTRLRSTYRRHLKKGE
ncbi:hypothetical protein QBC47DRAFT_377606 [Echria macrotheca]|uniref:Uncharacterized protein n=1 Tax=Echria macrotheca TaxID=438768 RepID=A0AAJ0BEZ8_9PEZI|nr:hypothetical protein QBC47DRAFT_377606 [Echria macrotheca]